MHQIYSLTLTANELLFVLVMMDVEDEAKYEEYRLRMDDGSSERVKDGRESLERRELVKMANNIPVLDDELSALVGATVVGKKQGHEYVEAETGLHVWFVKEKGMYLFRGYVEEADSD